MVKYVVSLRHSLGVFGGVMIAVFGALLVGRVLTWPLAHLTSWRLEYERTPAETIGSHFSLREFMCWISAIAAMLWYARAVFADPIVHNLVFETIGGHMLVAATMGMVLSMPVLVCAMLTGLRRSWSRLILLALAVLLLTLGEISVAWHFPVSWEMFAWSTLLYNALAATTVWVNFSILRAVGLRLRKS
jgi:hypothetical protein